MDSPRDLLLYVDDEEQALKYFQLTFAKDHEVLTAASADLAWPLIEKHADRLALVISDQRMPGRTGVELLTAVKERCPAAVRLLTTAYSDLSSAIAAVNKGAIYAYITKPWKLEELRVVIHQALQLYHVQSERDALLAEKLGVFQHLLLADHTRSLGISIAALAGQAKRPLAASTAWLHDRRDVFAIPESGGGDPRDLWPAVLARSRANAVLAGDVGVWLSGNRGPEAAVDAASVLAEAVAGIPGTKVEERASLTLKLDRSLLTAGFTGLLQLLRGLLPDPAAVASVTVRSGGSTILRLRVSGGGAAVENPDLAGLTAYLAICHHHGEIAISGWSTTGGEVTITLGGADDDGLGAYLTQLACCER